MKTTIKVPEMWSVAAAWENDKLEVLADLTWTGWSSIPTLAVDRADDSALSVVPLQFQDTWRAGLGANVKLDEKWTLRLGMAYDKAPVQDLYPRRGSPTPTAPGWRAGSSGGSTRR